MGGLLACPPLPVLQEARALLQFLIASLDDFAEDATKIALLYAVFWVLRLWRIPRAALWVAVLALHPAANYYADRLGNEMQSVQNQVRRAAGLRTKTQVYHKTNRSEPLLLTIVDDFVEDGFKLVCVWSHAKIGAGVSQEVVVPYISTLSLPGATRLAKLLGYIIVFGTPAGHYSACNQYGDMLGSAAQHQLKWLLPQAFKKVPYRSSQG